MKVGLTEGKNECNGHSFFYRSLTLLIFVIYSYEDKLCGLCGNYDGDTKDDFRKPDGSLTNNANDFGHSWNTDPELVAYIIMSADILCTYTLERRYLTLLIYIIYSTSISK